MSAHATEAEAPATSGAAPHRKNRVLPYLLALPALIALLVGMGYPLFWQVFNSFREYGLAQQFGKPPVWVGLDNYTRLLSDSEFWTILFRSIAFMLVTALVTMILGTLIALLMRAVPSWARIAVQVAMLLAWAMPLVTQMTVWNWLLSSRNGVINYLLSLLPGVEMIGHNWLVQPLSFFAVASIIITWASVPFVALSVYAGLTQVPDEIREAAALDGANGSKMFFFITVPMLRPIFVILLLLQMIWDLRVFAQINLLQGFGAAGSKYDLLGTYIYRMGIGQGFFGAAAAAAMLVMFITVGLSWFYIRELLKEDD